MRILIISYYYPPIRSVASERAFCFARYLARAGHEIEVLTCPARQDYINDAAGVRVHRIESKIISWVERRFSQLKTESLDTDTFRKPGMIQRLLAAVNRFRTKRGLGYLGRMPDMTDFWYLAAKPWLRGQSGWDCILSSYAPYSCLMLGHFAKQENKCRLWIADFRDLWTKHHFFRGLFPFTLIEKHLEKKVLKHADMVTTVSQGLAEQLALHCDVQIISNGFRPLEDIRDQADPLPETDRLRILYTGTLYPHYQNIIPVFRALQLLKTQQPELAAHLVFIFAGANRKLIQEYSALYQVQNYVQHLGLISAEAARIAQMNADYLLHIEMDTGAFAYPGIVPCKLFEYAASGKPTLFLGSGLETCERIFMRKSGTAHFLMNNPDTVYSMLIKISHKDPGIPVLEGDHSFIDAFSRAKQVAKLQAAMEKRLLQQG